MKQTVSFHILGLLSLSITFPSKAQIIDHNCADIHKIPTNCIVQAKQKLHIAYGHTSHGSQLITGMNELTGFMNGLGYPTNLHAWSETGANGTLHLDDYAFSGASDLGNPNYTAWESATRDYLATHTDCNVVIWSWCGQADTTEANINLYLSLMDGLRRDYTNVAFVYMTGHLTGTGTNGNLNLRNDQIRAHCRSNHCVLYDFADIESYDPDGLTNFMALLANDNCDYDSDGNGSRDRNWATLWQTSHTQNVDWYSCSPAHSQALNGNRKAYAAWWLWARLAGWPGTNVFQVWQRNHFTAPELTNPSLETTVWGRWADPDADGLANVFEYALGKSPRAVESAEPLLRESGFNAGGQFKLAYLRATGTEGVSFQLQQSPDLRGWSDVSSPALTNTVQTLPDGMERVELRFLNAPSAPAFYRLRLTAQ
jgi:hypothetical protein